MVGDEDAVDAMLDGKLDVLGACYCMEIVLLVSLT